jgi:predicted transglutaminase-like cysteine proteinase
MQRNVALKHVLWLSFFVAIIFAYLLADLRGNGLRSADLSTSRHLGLRFPDLSASQHVGLRFPDLSASQNVGLRFPDLSAFKKLVLRFPEAPAVGLLAVPDSTTAAALASPASRAQLIDLHADAALPPIGHSRFCLRYPDDCKVHGIDFRHRNITLTPERLNELNIVNLKVNTDIVATVTAGNGTTQRWLISPPTGDCKDYAVTKRHQLLARGWPSRSLLLSEVVIPSGEHHLFLVVRVKDADLVLDNLNDEIRLVSMTHDQYLWVRIQSPQNPKFWRRLRTPDAVHMAMLSY